MSSISIEDFTSLTGWTSNGTISAWKLNEHKDFIAGYNTYSIIFKIPAGNTGKYITKTVSKDISGNPELVMSAWSREKQVVDQRLLSNYYYSFDVGGTTRYYIPTRKDRLTTACYNLSGTNATSRIRIYANHNDLDYLILSHCVANNEDLPLDIFNGIKEALEDEVYSKIGTGIQLGTVTASAGASSITVTGSNYFLDRYAVITIKDGTHEEQHQIIESDGGTYKFSKMYDGKTLLNSFTAANVYLNIPVEFGQNESEVILPGIVIWGMTADRVYRGSGLEERYDTVTSAGTFSTFQEGKIQKFEMMIDCEARHDELIALMSEIVRKWIAKEKLWFNGQKYEIISEGSPTEIEPTLAHELIPKIQYVFSIEVKESMYSRSGLVPITTTNTTFTIEEQ